MLLDAQHLCLEAGAGVVGSCLQALQLGEALCCNLQGFQLGEGLVQSVLVAGLQPLLLLHTCAEQVS